MYLNGVNLTLAGFVSVGKLGFENPFGLHPTFTRPGKLDPFDLRAVLEGVSQALVGAVLKGTAEPLVLDADLSGSVGPAADLTGADPAADVYNGSNGGLWLSG